ncbi:MAG: hypothetical protein WC713_04275 [Candidatus Methylomirabilota bacterium]
MNHQSSRTDPTCQGCQGERCDGCTVYEEELRRERDAMSRALDIIEDYCDSDVKAYAGHSVRELVEGEVSHMPDTKPSPELREGLYFCRSACDYYKQQEIPTCSTPGGLCLHALRGAVAENKILRKALAAARACLACTQRTGKPWDPAGQCNGCHPGVRDA